MVMNVRNINASTWQMALGKPGEIVTDIDDINQQISVVVSTRRGDVAGRPELGSDVPLFVDRPINIAAPKCRKAVVDALKINVPHITVIDVIVNIAEAGSGKLQLIIKWVLAEGANINTAEVAV